MSAIFLLRQIAIYVEHTKPGSNATFGNRLIEVPCILETKIVPEQSVVASCKRAQGQPSIAHA